jgi:hypothetical protein
MVRFLDDHREEHGVEPICEVLPIAPSSYYAQKACELDPSKLGASGSRCGAAREDRTGLEGELRRLWSS